MTAAKGFSIVHVLFSARAGVRGPGRAGVSFNSNSTGEKMSELVCALYVF